MTWVLWLDDVRDPFISYERAKWAAYWDELFPPPFWCKDVSTAVAMVKLHGLPDMMYLDHDLGYGDSSGMDFLKWLQEKFANQKPPEYYLLTANVVAWKNMESFMESWLKVWENEQKEG